jgi:MFS family permease
LLNYIDRFILAALLKPIGDELGDLNQTQRGLLITAFFLSYTAFAPVVGWLGDCLPRKYLLALGVGIWSLATCGAGLAQSFGQMILARGVLGIGEATYAILTPALISDLFPPEKRNRALTIFYMAIPLGAALGYEIGPRVYTTWESWRLAFFIVGAPGLVTALAALALREPPRGAAEGVSEEDRLHHAGLPLSWNLYATLFRNRSYVFNTLGMAMATFALGGLQAWTPTYLEEVRGMTTDRAGTLLGVAVVVGGVVGTPLGGLLGDWLVGRFRGAYFWVSGLSMLAGVPFVTLALFAQQGWLIFLFILTSLTLAVMNYGPSNSINTNVTLPRIRVGALSLNLMLIHLLGDIPSPVLIGAVSDLAKMIPSLASHNLLLGLAITLPALLASGLFYCLGAPHLETDQKAVLEEMRSGSKS